MTSDVADTSTPVTRGELRDELARLESRFDDKIDRVVGVFLHKVFAWQRRRARKHGIADPRCGAVTFVQRFGSLRNLNCHAHALVPDGVFAASPDGSVLFRPLLPPPHPAHRHAAVSTGPPS